MNHLTNHPTNHPTNTSTDHPSVLGRGCGSLWIYGLIALIGACDRPPPESSPTPPLSPPAQPAQAAQTAPGVAPTPEPSPPPSLAPPPPRLAVAVEGHGRLGLDLIGERALVHSRGGIVALGQDGVVVERYANPGPEAYEIKPGPDSIYRPDIDQLTAEIQKIGGHRDGPLFMIHNTGGRSDYIPLFAYYDGSTWRRTAAVKGSIDDAWPWVEGSILGITLPEQVEDFPRLAVLRGEPKAPKLDALRAAMSACAADDRTHLASDAEPSGAVAVVMGCNSGTWVWTWQPGADEGAIARLAAAATAVRSLDLHADRLVIALSDAERSWVHERAASRWQELRDLPGRGPVQSATYDPQGALWLTRGGALFARGGATWTDQTPPGEGAIALTAGVDVGAPWVLRGERELSALVGQTWHAVTIPPAAFVNDRQAKVLKIEVSPRGQAWILGEFYAKEHGRTVASHFLSALTSGPVLHPLRHGEVLGQPAIAPTPWPRAAGPECGERLVIMLPTDGGEPRGDYKSIRRRLKGRLELAPARFIELDLGGCRLFGALVREPAAADALLAITLKHNRWRSPAVFCGDPDELTRAQVKIVRELPIDLATGELQPAG
ncbi:MAG: hypothetical protein IPK80_15435 [Nannocystis sp.]|nr:hypothetical protein [Nannocystis sp.]